MTNNTDPSVPLSVLRIYLHRSSSKPKGTFWARLFKGSLAYDLSERALKAGITYATVTLGHAGFVTGAKRIVADMADVPPTTLPTCVELVGPAAVLETFVESNRDELADAVLLRLDGVGVSLRGVSA